MLGIITFIIVFGLIVIVHEFGHLYFAKKSGILVREFSIGMGPKIFAHRSQDGTTYTLRILPLGGYVRMAGWGDDITEIKTGSPANLTLNKDGLVTCIDLSQKAANMNSLPMNVTSYDLDDKLVITGLVMDEAKTYPVNHDATIIEEDGTELRIAPLDVQYQNASVWGRLITNFAGPMNNFILGAVVFVFLAFLAGGVADYSSNHFRVTSDGAMYQAGVRDNDQILKIGKSKVTNWQSLVDAVETSTDGLKKGQSISVIVKSDNKIKKLTIIPKKQNGTYMIGVQPALKTSLADKILGGLKQAWDSAFLILNSLKGLITHFSINKLGGPVAMYQLTDQAARAGFETVLQLLAMLSINLGIMNLIPIPALDGGKIVINILEAIRRKPLRQETETYVTLAGVAIMFILMIAVTWNDIMRAFF
ncbi:RIP metalloprotease RseP [Streptococcus sciuri]|uniref:Zinc metalloprotease n=1 Tax=Streptococcus sciuri TaxID=2973939 RepID=A0ABT2F7Q5_9STRE|nr:RIP metalloprotease RseP [Streptococcus sciuri]MCS4488454.1 RIP metalloprotease RseP [Streptococcus sciuri]